MSYQVKDVFLTLQGEGVFSGRVAIFCRFMGCNLWSGYEKDRALAQCRFCDTDFVKPSTPHGGKFLTAHMLVQHLLSFWPQDAGNVPPFIVFTGGEPLLQLDRPLIDLLHHHGVFIAVESNGTIVAPRGIDWLCISPKAGCALQQKSGDELKLVYPQKMCAPHQFEMLDFQYFSLQPMDDGVDTADHTQHAIDYCLMHPRWSLSLQTHKMIGIA